MALVVSVIWVALVFWLIARAFRQRGVLARLAPAQPPGAGAAPHVAVVVPARDESANIGPCLNSLCAQQYPPDRLRIVVIDDESKDDTARIVAALARADRRIELLRTPALPPGWKGKVHACWTGVAAVPAAAEWLCFLDADMRAHPRLIASSVRAAADGALDLLSLAPRHELLSFAERLILPSGLYVLGFAQDLERIQAPDSADAVATGQFMLLRRAAYEEAGGHAAVCDSICEDVELARLLKRRGHRVLLQDGSDLLSTRMYTGWRTLWPGIAKNLSNMLGGPARTLATAVAAPLIAWACLALPVADAAACAHGAPGAIPALVLALMGSGALLGLHLAGAAHFRIPWWYGLLFPLGYTAGAVIAFDSLRWRLTGRVRWKGRVYQ